MKHIKKKSKSATIAELSVIDLREAAIAQQNIIDSAKEKMDAIQAELVMRYHPWVSDALKQENKQHGQHTFNVDGIKMTGEIKATVKWDSSALEKIAASLPWETVSRVFKIDFAVPEKNYKGITDQKLLDRLNEARTVKYSEPKISFSE